MVNEFQQKGYAVLFGMVALVLTFVIWGIMPPFYWLATGLIFFYLGVQIGKGAIPGRWLVLFLTVLPLWTVSVLLSIGKELPLTHLSLIGISLVAGAVGVWLSGEQPRLAEFMVQQYAWPLSLGLVVVLAATLLMFVVSASGLWPWKEIPPFGLTLLLALGGIAAWVSRRPGRLWWRDALLIWLIPGFFFLVYRPFLSPPPDPNAGADPAQIDAWMTGATALGLLLILTVSGLTRVRDNAKPGPDNEAV